MVVFGLSECPVCQWLSSSVCVRVCVCVSTAGPDLDCRGRWATSLGGPPAKGGGGGGGALLR